MRKGTEYETSRVNARNHGGYQSRTQSLLCMRCD